MLFFQIVGGILAFVGYFGSFFVIIRAFVRGYADWGWGLIALFGVMIGVFTQIGNIESFLLSLVFLTLISAAFDAVLVIGFLKTKKPDVPPLPCEKCGKEAMAKRRVLVNLDNNEVVQRRSTAIVLIVIGAAITIGSGFLVIFAIQYGQSVAAAGFGIMIGLSILGPNFNALLNKPKNVGEGYIYRCKGCREKIVHVPQAGEA